jgi:5,10-methenyltetrahydrofolate synthetase
MSRPADPDDAGGSFASPPCFLHELSEAEGGLPAAVDPVQARDVARWRRAERTRLLDERAALPGGNRQEAAAAIARRLDQALPDLAGKTVSAWWPIKAELDLRPWLDALWSRGARAALPLVVEKAAPLRFRLWRQGARMERGFWNIPVPAEGDWVIPDVALSPVVGHDPACYRLGYGGGYFDRTLAALGPRCLPVGIGLASSLVPTIFPQPHDIPMRMIVTEGGMHHPSG